MRRSSLFLLDLLLFHKCMCPNITHSPPRCGCRRRVTRRFGAACRAPVALVSVMRCSPRSTLPLDGHDINHLPLTRIVRVNPYP